MKQEATSLAKAIESELTNVQTLRGYEGLAPKALQLKVERRKRARDVVFSEQQQQPSDVLAARYADAVLEAVQAALQVAEGDAREVQRMQEEKIWFHKESKEEQQSMVDTQLSDTSSPQPFPETTVLSTSLIRAFVSPSQPKKVLRVHNSSLHTDVTISAASSVCSDDFLSKEAAAPIPLKKNNSLKKVMSSFGKRLLRSKSSASSSTASVDATWKQ
jgi:hypothetical protein